MLSKWRYKSLAIATAVNLLIAALVPVLGYFAAALLIPGAYPAFWLCNALDYGCRGSDEMAAWAAGWFLNVIFCWAAIWVVGAVCAKRS